MNLSWQRNTISVLMMVVFFLINTQGFLQELIELEKKAFGSTSFTLEDKKNKDKERVIRIRSRKS